MKTLRPHRTSATRTALAVVALAAVSAACSPATDPADPETSAAAPATPTESASAKPRLTVTYDGGLLVVDATTLEVVADLPLDGFNRVNPAGDGRHVLVSTTGGFRALDTGSWSRPHGDHAHHYVAEPRLTDVTFAAEEPGHAVVHDGRTALFDDGTGTVRIFDPATLADGAPTTREVTLPAAHHGVAIPRADDGLIVTVGTDTSRSGIAILDADDREIAHDDHCAAVHGEATTSDAIVVGCQDGMLVVRGDEIVKVDSPDGYGRIGNQAGSHASPIVLGDYKTDKDAELERPERISLVDTTTAQMRLVDLGTSYTFRSLGRGPKGEALVLGTDGNLLVIDENTGTVTRRIPVLDAWTEPDEWQAPRPALFVRDRTAYVTDPATRRIIAVDIASGDLVEGSLPQQPNEITGT